VLVASSAPLDQFIVRHPEFFFGASPEHALINPDNLHILLDHVKCAAFELPFQASETFGSLNVQEILSVLSEDGFVHRTGTEWQWTHESYPADAVSLRSVTSDNFVIVDTTHGERVIGETDFTSGPSTLHEKAIYLMEGQLYQVDRFDYEGRKAFVRRAECDYYTDAITYTKVTILDTFQGGAAGALSASGSEDADTPEQTLAPSGAGAGDRACCFGEVHVVSRVVGFKKIKFYTNENVGSGELDLPEQQMHTTAYWMTLSPSLIAGLHYGADDRRDGVIGLAYAMHHVAPLLLMCDAHDLGLSVDGVSLEGASRMGGTSRGASPDLSNSPTVFLYDNYPGGIGLSEPLFAMHDALLRQTRDLIAGCPCEAGCPSCVGPAGASGPLAKTVALAILDRLVVAVQAA
jgi:DEAD/DEAH box helicase domain-containing protein